MAFHTPEELKDYVEKETKELVDSLTNLDIMVVAILQFHLLTEQLLERIIESELPSGHLITKKSGFTYYLKLEIVNALNILNENIIGSLRMLNQVRNDFSHNRDMIVNIKSIEKIGLPLGKVFRDIKTKYKEEFYTVAIHTFALIYQELLTEVLVSENKGPQLQTSLT